jgi:hypothetical protein
MMLAASDAVLTAIGVAPVAFLIGLFVGWQLRGRWGRYNGYGW